MSKRLYTKEEVADILRYRHNATTVMDEYQAIREWNSKGGFGELDIEGAKKHIDNSTAYDGRKFKLFFPETEDRIQEGNHEHFKALWDEAEAKNGIKGGDGYKVMFKETTKEFYDGKKHDKHFEDESPMVLKPSIEKKWGAKLNLTPDEREKIRESTGTTNPETENNEDGSWNYKPETVNPWDVVTDEDFDRAISGLSLIDALKEEE